MEESLHKQLADLKRENIQLKQKLEFSRKFMANSNYWETYRDLTGKIIYISPNLEETLGERREAYIKGNIKITDFVHEDDIEVTIENYKKVMQGLEVPPHKCRMKSNLSFEHVLIDYKRVYDNDGQLNGIRTCISDITELERKERHIHANQKLLQTITDKVPAFIALVDRSFNFLFVNNYYSGNDLFERESTIGKSIIDTIGRERFEKHLPYFKEALKGESVEYEINHQSKIQKEFTFKINLVPYNKHQEVVGLLIYVFDISETRKFKNTIKENEQKFKSLYKLSHISTAIVGLDKRIISCNDAFCRLFGYTKKSDLRGKTIADFTHPDDRKIGMGEMKKIVKGEMESAFIQKRYINKEGNVVWGELSISIVRNENNEPLYFIAAVQDITSRHRAEEQLKESINNLRLITDNIPALVGRIDDELKYIYVNKNYEIYSGIEVNSIIGKNVKDVISEDTFKISQPYMLRALSGEFVRFETRYKNSEGEVFYFLSNFVPHIEDNRIKNFFVLAWDITAVKKSEMIIQKQNEHLKEAIATKDKLFSIIAHDLRNPFINIISLSELLIGDEKDSYNAQSGEFADLIHSAAVNTLALLDNLLNWAKSQSDQLSIKHEKITLTSLIREVINTSNSRALIKNISLKLIQAEEVDVYTDENMLTLILRNLISNAIKFTNPGGKINVIVIPRTKQVEISVSDNGVGMNEEKIKTLFKISSNTTSPGTKNEKGSGLGLILCKEFVEKLGGNIWVESANEKGSNFRFTIPFSK